MTAFTHDGKNSNDYETIRAKPQWRNRGSRVGPEAATPTVSEVESPAGLEGVGVGETAVGPLA